MAPTGALWIAAATVAVAFGGCIDTIEDYYGFDADGQYYNPGVFPGTYSYAESGSNVLFPGPLEAEEPEIIRLVSDRPAYPSVGENQVAEAEVTISMAIWRPANASSTVPVIVDAGPYYEIGQSCPNNSDPCNVPLQNDTIDKMGQRTPFLVRNMLPHGYAVAQVAVRGTGTSGGCMDLLGPDEQADLVQAIEYLASRDWSNGNVAMIGASYDGTTPWLVAASGTPALKTIVPTAGLPDIYGLMYHNGTPEFRSAFMHSEVYWGFGFEDNYPHPMIAPLLGSQANGRADHQNRHNLLCSEVVEGTAVGAYSTTTGDRGDEASTYWAERDYRQRVLDNYDGSIFLIHGLQDWNVDPHAVIPFNKQLREAGFTMKEWYGQWGHSFPDSECTKEPTPDWVVLPCRLDFADVLKRWFDRELKGIDVDVGAPVHVQDNLGYWRHMESYPPDDVEWTTFQLGAETIGRPGTSEGAETAILLQPGINGPGNTVRISTAPFEEDVHISGLPQIKLPFEVIGQGGEIGVWLFDENPDGQVRALGAVLNPEDGIWYPNPRALPLVGHQQMNLRYYAGGEDPQVLLPATRYIAQIELEPVELHIPAGNKLTMWIFQYHYPDHAFALTARQDTPDTGVATVSPVNIYLGGVDAQLRLPIVDVDPRTVFPVPGAQFPNETYQPRMYIDTPDLPSALETLPLPPVADREADASNAPTRSTLMETLVDA